MIIFYQNWRKSRHNNNWTGSNMSQLCCRKRQAGGLHRTLWHQVLRGRGTVQVSDKHSEWPTTECSRHCRKMLRRGSKICRGKWRTSCSHERMFTRLHLCSLLCSPVKSGYTRHSNWRPTFEKHTWKYTKSIQLSRRQPKITCTSAWYWNWW